MTEILSPDEIKNIANIPEFRGKPQLNTKFPVQNLYSRETGLIAETQSITLGQISKGIVDFKGILAQIFDNGVIVNDPTNGFTLARGAIDRIEDEIATIDENATEIDDILLVLRGIIENRFTGEELINLIDVIASKNFGMDIFLNQYGQVVFRNTGYEILLTKLDELSNMIVVLQEQINQIQTADTSLIRLQNATFFTHREEYLKQTASFASIEDWWFVDFEILPSMLFFKQRIIQASDQPIVRYIKAISSKNKQVFQHNYGLSFNGIGNSQIIQPRIINNDISLNQNSLKNVEIGTLNIPAYSRYSLSVDNLVRNPFIFQNRLVETFTFNGLIGFKANNLRQYLLNNSGLVLCTGNQSKTVNELSNKDKLNETLIRLFISQTQIQLIISTKDEIFVASQNISLQTNNDNDLFVMSFCIDLSYSNQKYFKVNLASFLKTTEAMKFDSFNLPMQFVNDTEEDIKEFLLESRTNLFLCGGNFDYEAGQNIDLNISHFAIWDIAFNQEETKVLYDLLFGL